MIRKVLTATAIFMFIFVFTTAGYTDTTSVALKAGALGAGLEVERSFSDSIGARIGVNYFTYDHNATEDGIEYKIDLQLQSISAMIDWHPFQGSFRISTGALINRNEIELNSHVASSYTVGEVTYNSTQVSALKAVVDFDDIAPYVGVGWDGSYGKQKAYGFICELGMLYQGSPNVDLTATGTLADNAAFKAELAKEQANLENSLDDYEFYPVFSVGVSYRY